MLFVIIIYINMQIKIKRKSFDMMLESSCGRWEERRTAKKFQVGALERMKEEEKKGRGKRRGDEYRIKKQRIHAGLWVKEIEKLEESRIGGGNRGNDIDRLLDSCAE